MLIHTFDAIARLLWQNNYFFHWFRAGMGIFFLSHNIWPIDLYVGMCVYSLFDLKNRLNGNLFKHRPQNRNGKNDGNFLKLDKSKCLPLANCYLTIINIEFIENCDWVQWRIQIVKGDFPNDYIEIKTNENTNRQHQQRYRPTLLPLNFWIVFLFDSVCAFFSLLFFSYSRCFSSVPLVNTNISMCSLHFDYLL